MRMEDIRPYHLKQFLAMMDGKHRKPRYINDLLKVAKTFLNYCKREEVKRRCNRLIAAPF